MAATPKKLQFTRKISLYSLIACIFRGALVGVCLNEAVILLNTTPQSIVFSVSRFQWAGAFIRP